MSTYRALTWSRRRSGGINHSPNGEEFTPSAIAAAQTAIDAAQSGNDDTLTLIDDTLSVIYVAWTGIDGTLSFISGTSTAIHDTSILEDDTLSVIYGTSTEIDGACTAAGTAPSDTAAGLMRGDAAESCTAEGSGRSWSPGGWENLIANRDSPSHFRSIDVRSVGFSVPIRKLRSAGANSRPKTGSK